MPCAPERFLAGRWQGLNIKYDLPLEIRIEI